MTLGILQKKILTHNIGSFQGFSQYLMNIDILQSFLHTLPNVCGLWLMVEGETHLNQLFLLINQLYYAYLN